MSLSRYDLEPRRGHADLLIWLGPILYTVLVGLFLVFRYDGLWAESDSAALTHAIQGVSEGGRLVPESGEIYSNGYTYQVISTFLMAASGLEVVPLQQLVYPVLACLVILPAWLFYRELTGSVKGAALASMLLITQPEFLFVVLRSSHEKFTRALILLCLYFLIRSVNVSESRRIFGIYVALFYFAAFALIASNTFIAHSFILALAIAFMAGRILQRRNQALKRQNDRTMDRLPYVLMTTIVGVYLFSFYIYPPALHQISVIESVWGQLATLFLGTDSTASNAYTTVSIGWTSIQMYFLVSAANWIMIVASFTIWCSRGLRWFWRAETPPSSTSLLIWLIYAAFAVQGALSVVVDMSGALSGNAQQRLFPSFSIFAVALVADTLARWHPRRNMTSLRVSAAVVIAAFAVLSVFKAVNEPLVSNTWIFYRTTEIAALDWSDHHITNAQVWTEYDQRLAVAWDMERHRSQGGNHYYGGSTPFTTRTVVLSDATRLRSTRLRRDLPIPADAFRIYDNGEAEVYYLRPQTPYQR